LTFGNAEEINKYFNRIKKNFKVVFLGDSIFSDCVYSFHQELKNTWDICFIYHELNEIEDGKHGKHYLNYWQYWGSALFDKAFYNGVVSTQTFDFAQNIAHRTFSSCYSEECIDFLSLK